MGLKKIGLYELVTPEKRKKTLDVLTTENRDIRQKITNSLKRTKLLVLLEKEKQ